MSRWFRLEQIFPRNIWTLSEKSVPTIDQPQEGKSVTTKDISGVHSGVSRKGMTVLHEYASAAPCNI